MSYAAAASMGPKQSPEEARAPAPPTVIPNETASTTASETIDVDSPHVATVGHDFKEQEIKTSTQETRIEYEEEHVKARAVAEEQRLKKEFHEKEAKAKKEFNEKKEWVQKNEGNPVVIGNAVAVVALSAGLGFGAYRKYIAGELTWKVVGAWAGVVGLFAAGDYYLSKYLFKNKYPERK